jgi:hypothetical protein
VVARATTAVLTLVASTRADEQPAEDAAVDIRELPELRQRLSSSRVHGNRQSCERRVQIPPRSQCQQWPRSRSGVGGGGTGSDVRARYQRKPRPQCPHGSMRSSECEESGRKLVPGFTRAGRTEGRSGRRRIASLLLRGKPDPRRLTRAPPFERVHAGLFRARRSFESQPQFFSLSSFSPPLYVHALVPSKTSRVYTVSRQ